MPCSAAAPSPWRPRSSAPSRPSSPDFERPNVQFHVQPLSLDKFGDELHPFDAITVSVCNLRPESRGAIHIVSKDAAAAPKIAPHYLSAEADRRVAVDSIRLARRVAAAPALARFRPEEYRPGAALTTDDELAEAAGAIGTTIFHPVGTARMGLPSDPAAVTDARLAVLGVEGLRVIDASVMPRITSGNTNSPTS